MANRILYGDDQEQNRERVAQSLRERGYHVDLVCSDQEFISKARNGKYNGLISDLDYSPDGAEGYQVIKKLKEVPSLKILFTARDGFENAAEGLEAGADWVVMHKNLEELVEVLEKELKGGEEK